MAACRDLSTTTGQMKCNIVDIKVQNLGLMKLKTLLNLLSGRARNQNFFSDGRYHGAQVFYGPEGESQAMAKALQTAFCQTINPGSNREIKKADGIYLMQHIDRTGVLIECGFLSNPQEDSLLQTKEYQQRINCVIAGTLSQFLTDS